MSDKSQVFSHQKSVAFELSKYYSSVDIISLGDSQLGNKTMPLNVSVHHIDWENGRYSFLKVVRLVQVFVSVLLKHGMRDTLILSHMTDIASAILSPLSRLLGISHLLWYAHSNYSIYLRISKWFVTRILTSTKGSCPYQGKKLLVIGQMVDSTIFLSDRNRDFKSVQTVVHVGRIDPSKNVVEVVQAFMEVYGQRDDVKLILIGEPSPGNEDYFDEIQNLFHHEIGVKKILLMGAVTKEQVRDWMNDADLLLHAYRGSLDKVLVEAALMELPILSTNSEFINSFGHGVRSSQGTSIESLSAQLRQFDKSLPEDILKIVKERRILALTHHSLSSWIANFKRVVG